MHNEPTVVIARGVIAFDEWGHALGARVGDRRAQADTMPGGEVDVDGGWRATFRQSALLVLAATVLLASAVFLVHTTGTEDRIATAVASAPVSSIVDERAGSMPSLAPTESVRLIAAAAAAESPTLPPELPALGVATTSAVPTAVVDVGDVGNLPRARLTGPERVEKPAAVVARRARVAPKTKRGDIVRESPF